MTEQDQAHLTRISDLLAELKPLIYGVSHLIDQDCYNPYAPIAPVEPNTIAQTEPIKEERWEITIEPFRYNSKDNRITLALTNDNILSEAEANEIALKIKQLLTTL